LAHTKSQFATANAPPGVISGRVAGQISVLSRVRPKVCGVGVFAAGGKGNFLRVKALDQPGSLTELVVSYQQFSPKSSRNID